MHSIYGVKRFHSLSEFHSIQLQESENSLPQRVKIHYSTSGIL